MQSEFHRLIVGFVVGVIFAILLEESGFLKSAQLHNGRLKDARTGIRHESLSEVKQRPRGEAHTAAEVPGPQSHRC